MNNLKDILEKWQSDLQFRQDFHKNPEAALKSAGLELDIKDLEKVRAMLQLKQKGTLNDDLEKKINK